MSDKLNLIVHTIPRGIGQGFGWSVFSKKVLDNLAASGRVTLVPSSDGAGTANNDSLQLHLWLCPLFVLGQQFVRRSENERHVAFTMWEAERLPVQEISWLKKLDMVITPSRWNTEVFRNAGISRVRTARLGVDEGFKFDDDYRNRKFRFLWIGAPGARKGLDIVLRAFKSAFKLFGVAELYIKSTTTNAVYGEQVKQSDDVIVDTRPIDVSDLVKLYCSAQAFVFPSRGEGFGLPALEAMASGCLVLAPATTGMTEFVSQKTAQVLKTHRGYANFGCDTPYAEVDVEMLAECMRWTARNWDTTMQKRLEASAWARSEFTWGRTSDAIIEAIQELV